MYRSFEIAIDRDNNLILEGLDSNQIKTLNSSNVIYIYKNKKTEKNIYRPDNEF